MIPTGLLKSGIQNNGFLKVTEDESENQASQTLEAALKKKREKMAEGRLGLAPEQSNEV